MEYIYFICARQLLNLLFMFYDKRLQHQKDLTIPDVAKYLFNRTAKGGRRNGHAPTKTTPIRKHSRYSTFYVFCLKLYKQEFLILDDNGEQVVNREPSTRAQQERKTTVSQSSKNRIYVCTKCKTCLFMFPQPVTCITLSTILKSPLLRTSNAARVNAC